MSNLAQHLKNWNWDWTVYVFSTVKNRQKALDFQQQVIQRKSLKESVATSSCFLTSLLLVLLFSVFCCFNPCGVINMSWQSFQTTEMLKIHNPKIKRKGLSPESFRNSLCMYFFSGEMLWHMAWSSRLSHPKWSVCLWEGSVPHHWLHVLLYQQ